MSDVPHICSVIEQGDPNAAAQLLPLVYDELKKLAAKKLANEPPGQTLQATALVHDAYLRLVGDGVGPHWSGRGHFFAAAATAMRRILIERARQKRRDIHGGAQQRRELRADIVVSIELNEDLLELDTALARLAELDPVKARLVELRYFAGLTRVEAAEILDISARTAYRYLVYALAWLRREMDGSNPGQEIEESADAVDGLSSH